MRMLKTRSSREADNLYLKTSLISRWLHPLFLFLVILVSRNTCEGFSSTFPSSLKFGLKTTDNTRSRILSSFLHRQHNSNRLSRSFLVNNFFRSSSYLYSSSNDYSSSLTSNESLVKSRISTQIGKRSARKKCMEEDRQRNLRLKQLLHTDANAEGSSEDTEFQVPALFALKVSVDKELREELNLNGREKRGRVFIEMGTDGCTTLKGLKQEIHSFFRCLKKSTYLVGAALPEVSSDGTIVSPSSEDMDTSTFLSTNSFWTVDSDNDVQETFSRVMSHYESSPQKDLFKRPSLLLHIYKDPNAPPPPPPPSYLKEMPNPAETESMTMLSFYSFPIPSIQNPEEFGETLRKVWKPFGALGRVYVAEEGVNAQMSVPTNVMSNFMECCKSIPELGEYMENGINIDPITLTMEEFGTAGVPISENDPPSPPFKALHVRVRAQIVADGLSAPLNWQSAGYDMPAREWHERIKDAKDGKTEEEEKPLLLDCRNQYETGVGRFDLAEPLNTENFRDSWSALEERLKDVPKDAPIMTYCTGGIRCVKVGAYLTQQLNFTNVSRLAGGIIAYDRNINTDDSNEESMFKGTNYVFDGRVGRAITNDALGDCVTCGTKTSLLSNCRNPNCHKRMVQCEKCRDNRLGTCSDACKQRVVNVKNRGMIPLRKRGSMNADEKQMQKPKNKLNNVEDYAEYYSSPGAPLLKEIQKNTEHFLPSGAHMVSGSTQGQLLKTLASLTQSGKVLEVGTFTGYATACFWNGVQDRDGGYVLSLERDLRAIEIAGKHLSIMEEFGLGAKSAEMAKLMRESDKDSANDLIKVEEGTKLTFRTDKSECNLVHVTDALATMEEIVAKSGTYDDLEPFDLIFIDADKTRLLEYVDASLSLLNKGGMILVDNVLWKGLVLDVSGTVNEEEEEEDDLSPNSNKEEIKRSRRARRLAGIMHRFNEAIAEDDRVEVMMLPIRDGLTIIRKK